jgi:hypothetical protein
MFGLKIFKIKNKNDEWVATDYINRTTNTIYDEERARGLSENEDGGYSQNSNRVDG